VNIGELSRLTGLPVKTIRYYSDVGLVPETDRTGAGYRQYDHGSLIRLEFVRTLRELGLDLATVRRVLDRGEDLAAVAAAHAEAMGAQIRVLKLRRAALRALAKRQPTPSEVNRMTRIAQATADERRRILTEFLDSIFDGVPAEASAGFQSMIRNVSADLPDDPTDEQVDAWIELADLLRDTDFRQRLRAMSQRSFGTGAQPLSGEEAGRLSELVFTQSQRALDAAIAPDSPQATPFVDQVVSAWAAAAGRTDTPDYRRELLGHAEVAYEPRAERYWQLLAVINGWPPIPGRMHLWGWFVEALQARQGD